MGSYSPTQDPLLPQGGSPRRRSVAHIGAPLPRRRTSDDNADAKSVSEFGWDTGSRGDLSMVSRATSSRSRRSSVSLSEHAVPQVRIKIPKYRACSTNYILYTVSYLCFSSICDTNATPLCKGLFLHNKSQLEFWLTSLSIENLLLHSKAAQESHVARAVHSLLCELCGTSCCVHALC